MLFGWLPHGRRLTGHASLHMSIEQIATSQGDASRGLLLERAHVIDSIAGGLTAARAGSGSFTFVLASAGLGKTALLDRVAALATEKGLTVMTARAGELERGMPFGVARQLFALPVRGLTPGERRSVLTGSANQARGVIGLEREIAAEDPIGVMDGLYWLAANLAYRAPVVLLIDDVHWIDPQTARWLSYLERRYQRPADVGDRGSATNRRTGGRIESDRPSPRNQTQP